MDFSPGSELRQMINKEFMSPEHKCFRDMYFQTFTPSEKALIKILYYQDLSKQNKVIWFCKWFKEWFPTQDYIQVLEDHTKIWTSVDGKQFKTHHPPTETLHIIRKASSDDQQDIKFEASALMQPLSSNIDNSKSIIAQNNWTNMALFMIGKQMDRMECSSSSSKEAKDIPSSSVVYPVDIHPPLSVPDFKLTDKQDDDFIDLLVAKLQKTSLSVLQEDGEASDDDVPTDSAESLQHIQQMEASLQKLEYEPSGLKTYYKRPTPQDLLFEEDFFQNQVSYNGRSIYEWNMDGLSEYQIHEVLHKMLMYASVCKTAGNDDKNVAMFIINGFTGCLRGWWDNSLTAAQRDRKSTRLNSSH